MHQGLRDGGASVAAALSDASAALAGALASPQWWQLSGRELTASVDAAYRLVAQAQAVALSLLGEFDDRRLGMDAGAVSTAGWLSGRRRIRPQDAKRDVTLARLLHHAETFQTAVATATAATAALEEAVATADDADAGLVEGTVVRAGLAAGRLTADQASVIAAALAELPDEAGASTRLLAEQLLVREAGVHGPVALTRLGHRIGEHVDPDAADRTLAAQLAREEQQARRLRTGTRWADGHGSVFYKFRVPIGDDALLWPVLDTLAAPEPAGDGIGDTDTRSPQQRLADAFVEAVRRVSLDGRLPSRGGDRPRVLLAMDYDKLKAGVGAATIVDTGDLVDPGTLRRLACDAQLIPQLLNGPSQLLDQGRAVRTVSGPLRVAVYARDGGCVHPGCTRPPRWCDVHHVIAWWDGGPTNLTNCVTLCGYHHQRYDSGTWTIRFAADGTPEAIPPPWMDPDQRPIRHERYKERRAP